MATNLPPYGSVIHDKGTARNLITYFLPLPKAERQKFNKAADYGGVKIVSGTMSIENAKQIIGGLVDRAVLSVPGVPEVAVVDIWWCDVIR